MRPLIVDVPIEIFTKFFSDICKKHYAIEQYEFRLHRLNSYQKNYANEILESYYGMHYAGISPKNSENYCFSVVDKKLYMAAKLKFGI